MTDSKPTKHRNSPEDQKVRTVLVEPERAGQRLDNLLLRELKGVPKSRVYRLVRTGQVRVNGGRCKVHQRVAAGDRIRIPPVRQAPTKSHQFSSEQQAEIRARIIDQDKNFLAIDKPVGMAVHAGSGISWGLIELIRSALPDETLELVHRIDRGTSGVILLARHRRALLAAQDRLRAGQMEKRYLCLLHGRLPEQRLRVDVALRKVGGGKNSRVIVAADGKPSLSEFVDLQKLKDGNTFAQCDILTGRTHQVRVHAAHIGHPLLGDTQYGGPRHKALERPALHCASMTFDGDFAFSAQAPLADDIRRIVDG